MGRGKNDNISVTEVFLESFSSQQYSNAISQYLTIWVSKEKETYSLLATLHTDNAI